MNTVECPWCGPHIGIQQNGAPPVCPTCGMDEHEVRYAQKIIDLGGAEVYRQEWRAEQARKRVKVGSR